MGRSGNKYGASAVTLDGRRFDSRAEAHRWAQLRLEERAGQIRDLVHHKRFDLHAPGPNGALNRVGAYEADFCYIRADTGAMVVEDVKGMARTTDLFRWKKRHLKAEYGIEVVEVRPSARRRTGR